MRFSKTTLYFIAVVAVLLIVCCVVIVFTNKKAPLEDIANVPTPNDIIYDLSFEKELIYDINAVKAYYISDSRYVDYELKKEYCMLYQICDEDSGERASNILGMTSQLPQTDYSKKYLLLSVGRKIDMLGTDNKNVDTRGMPVVTVTYSDEYYEGIVFVYTMNPRKISSGEDLEYYYWENISPLCNMVNESVESRTIVSEGKYHKLFLRRDGFWECLLFGKNGETLNRKFLLDKSMEITEISETLVKLDCGETNKYYSPAANFFSQDFDCKTGYLVYNIITYMRVYDGEIQLILRDAYNSSLYTKIVRLPFTNDTSDLDSLLKSITVIDDTSVWVEYYTGDDRTLVKETVEVYNLQR